MPGNNSGLQMNNNTNPMLYYAAILQILLSLYPGFIFYLIVTFSNF